MTDNEKYNPQPPSWPDPAQLDPQYFEGRQPPPPEEGALPPPGTVPPGATSYYNNMPPYWQPPPPQKKGRRVGTFTMALCLIVVGVILILRVFLPGLDYLTMARLSPVVLILLGVEMLVAHALHKEEKLRFDGLSIFVSLVLIGGSLVAAAVPEVVQVAYMGSQVGDRLAAELELETSDALIAKGDIPVYNIEWYVNVERTTIDNDMAPADLRPEHYVQARVFLTGGYTEPTAFARDCRRVLDVVEGYVPHIDYISFYSAKVDDGSYVGDVTFSLWLENRIQLDYDAAKLADMVQTNYWDGEGQYYMPEWEYNERAEAQPEAQDGPEDPEDPDIIGDEADGDMAA